MLVSSRDLERSIARVRAMAANQESGVFGPDSWAWRVNRESIVLLAGGAAALLQLAHPYVAYAVAEHSRTRADLVGRFQRTFDHVLTMAFGDLDRACRRAWHLHRMHDRIHGRIPVAAGRFPAGQEYHANDPEALLWVHATLVSQALEVYQSVLGPLEPDERERYYQDSKRFAYLFGIPDLVIPDDYLAFERYMAETLDSDVITVTPPAREIAGFLLRGKNSLDEVVWRGYRSVTASFLPARLRADFGLSFGPSTRALVRAGVSAWARVYRALPGSVRFFPEYLDAVGHGIPGARGSDSVQRALRAVLARHTR